MTSNKKLIMRVSGKCFVGNCDCARRDGSEVKSKEDMPSFRDGCTCYIGVHPEMLASGEWRRGKSPAKIYEEETNQLFDNATKAMIPCSCGETPLLEFPIYTTQICTFVRCGCGKMAHGEPEDPMSAVLKWNEANETDEIKTRCAAISGPGGWRESLYRDRC